MRRQTSILDLTRFVGKPYRQGARGPEAYDCYGLAQAIAAARGFVLPNQATPAGLDLRMALFRRAVIPFLEPIHLPEPFALAVFDLGRRGPHIATLTDEPGRIIHTSACTGAVRIERLNRTIYHQSLFGLYRCAKAVDHQVCHAATTA